MFSTLYEILLRFWIIDAISLSLSRIIEENNDSYSSPNEIFLYIVTFEVGILKLAPTYGTTS